MKHVYGIILVVALTVLVALVGQSTSWGGASPKQYETWKARADQLEAKQITYEAKIKERQLQGDNVGALIAAQQGAALTTAEVAELHELRKRIARYDVDHLK
jgi:hypothetical protein